MSGSLAHIDRLIIASLSPDLRAPAYDVSIGRTMLSAWVAGHCYIASEAAYHLYAKKLGYKPCHVKYTGVSHWFLAKRAVGRASKAKYRFRTVLLDIIDLTYEQFDRPVPYEAGTCKGFLTKQPSKRAATLMARVSKRRNKTRPKENDND